MIQGPSNLLIFPLSFTLSQKCIPAEVEVIRKFGQGPGRLCLPLGSHTCPASTAHGAAYIGRATGVTFATK